MFADDEGGISRQIVEEIKRRGEEIWHQKGLCERTTFKVMRMQWEA